MMLTPVGMPDALNTTSFVVPAVSDGVTVFVVNDPCVTDTFKGLGREKLKFEVMLTVRDAEVQEREPSVTTT